MGLIQLTERERALCLLALRERPWFGPRDVLLAWGRLWDVLGLDSLPELTSLEALMALDNEQANEFAPSSADDRDLLLSLLESHQTDGRLGMLKVGLMRKLLA